MLCYTGKSPLTPAQTRQAQARGRKRVLEHLPKSGETPAQTSVGTGEGAKQSTVWEFGMVGKLGGWAWLGPSG